jgi:hypothetical protein
MFSTLDHRCAVKCAQTKSNTTTVYSSTVAIAMHQTEYSDASKMNNNDEEAIFNARPLHGLWLKGLNSASNVDEGAKCNVRFVFIVSFLSDLDTYHILLHRTKRVAVFCSSAETLIPDLQRGMKKTQAPGMLIFTGDMCGKQKIW